MYDGKGPQQNDSVCIKFNAWNHVHSPAAAYPQPVTAERYVYSSAIRRAKECLV